jgi:hypothetical protein
MRGMRGDLDSGTVPSWQSHTSEMRTDESYPDDDVPKLMTQNGYILDSSSDEVSSEDSLSSSTGQEQNNSGFLSLLETLSSH